MPTSVCVILCRLLVIDREQMLNGYASPAWALPNEQLASDARAEFSGYRSRALVRHVPGCPLRFADAIHNGLATAKLSHNVGRFR